ncbi:hypothetical protein QE152_g7930 [Popillia japonica]|uniref:Uncharacterized protein n=1 Tax=Popillia japonica TaxID=7064 RepID=A0AAW1MDH8_POPJA
MMDTVPSTRNSVQNFLYLISIRLEIFETLIKTMMDTVPSTRISPPQHNWSNNFACSYGRLLPQCNFQEFNIDLVLRDSKSNPEESLSKIRFQQFGASVTNPHGIFPVNQPRLVHSAKRIFCLISTRLEIFEASIKMMKGTMP